MQQIEVFIGEERAGHFETALLAGKHQVADVVFMEEKLPLESKKLTLAPFLHRHRVT